ncbi:putative AC transposase [Hypsizygus marmoreus]|uniref:AC transposase n=1 Tax=Hypsizygus marmoreus TaxID=39966 RepID=A0A369JCU5_HYPMA|nr:putative AC transposase [Hypsizygus marmoreus]
MDYLDSQLASQAINPIYSTAIQAAVTVGKKLLNSYYDKTDHSEIYRIAMILHPQFKLNYFKRAGWEPEWIDTARGIIQDEFARAYADIEVEIGEQVSLKLSTSHSTNIFDNLPLLSPPVASELHNELHVYLGTNIEVVEDPLQWWHSKHSTFPCLSRMAMDYLSIPATSVNVECVFSKGRLVLSHIRNRLSVESTRALMCLGAWSRLDFVKDKDIIAATSQPAVPDEGELEENWEFGRMLYFALQLTTIILATSPGAPPGSAASIAALVFNNVFTHLSVSAHQSPVFSGAQP